MALEELDPSDLSSAGESAFLEYLMSSRAIEKKPVRYGKGKLSLS